MSSSDGFDSAILVQNNFYFSRNHKQTCSISHYRFPSEVSRQYTIGTSIKRAFTINFRTICFGSFFEALIKALRSSTKDNRRKSILSCIFKCILWMIDDFIGYLNEWTFIYAALTGQGFVQGS
ncbi:unnamed protein product [Rotaria sordida]|uniref:Choline transporter-like protein n=1 Tax=Rotaria sordida TaxID=392033 RepID=A0A814G3M7_9BILA|nr:unnamed protein product [Rotaria sordida]